MKSHIIFFTKLLSLIGLISAQVWLGAYLWDQWEPKTLKGALAKEGSAYVLRWLNDDKTVGVKSFSSPLLAMVFAQKELLLVPGENPRLTDSLEHVWLRKEMGKQVMLWKTLAGQQVHRLTFQNEQHANLFVASFKQGAYSPSPLGHAIYLVPFEIKTP